MPGVTSRTTRSNGIGFPAAKKTTAASSAAKATTPSAMTLLFRREVQSMLSAPPCLPSHVPKDTPVEVIAVTERLSSSGIQQSVQLCQAGGEQWVTRTEGARQYFPRAGRVQKRLRGGDDEVDGEDEAPVRDDSARLAEVDEDESTQNEQAKRKKKARKSHGDAEETPRTSTSSSGRRKSAPDAPIKHKKTKKLSSRKSAPATVGGDGVASEDVEFDDGASTETDRSHLARTRGPSNPSSLEVIDEARATMEHGLRRSQRGRSVAGDDLTDVSVKREEGHDEADDLASLCGRVDGIGFRSTVDPESECERTPGPEATSAKRTSTPTRKSKARV